MADNMCIVEGCDQEYDVTCSFSFYNGCMVGSEDVQRQEWIDNAVSEDSECHWRNVSLRLCGYHFESDDQSLWIESPMLADLMNAQQNYDLDKIEDVIRLEHNYSAGNIATLAEGEHTTRLNVRRLMEALGYLSFKQIQRKQLWVVAVDPSDSQFATVTQAEQVITKMSDPNASTKQIIELIPTSQHLEGGSVMTMDENGSLTENLVYEIGDEHSDQTTTAIVSQEGSSAQWTLNIVSPERPKYAFIRHYNTGKKKKHFPHVRPGTLAVQQLDMPGERSDFYILPDADPQDGVEVSTTYEVSMPFDVGSHYEVADVADYPHLVLQQEASGDQDEDADSPESRGKKGRRSMAKVKRKANVREQVKKIKQELHDGSWEVYQEQDLNLTDQNLTLSDQNLNLTENEELSSEDHDDDRKSRVRRKNKKYFTYDYVT